MISFVSCLVTLAATNRMLNKSGESRHPCLTPCVLRKTFSLLQFTLKLYKCIPPTGGKNSNPKGRKSISRFINMRISKHFLTTSTKIVRDHKETEK